MTDQTAIPTTEAHPEVPQGMYCYTHTPDPVYDAERQALGKPFIPGRYAMCPHWELRADKPSQQNGYCKLLQAGDWEDEGTLLLWDQVKECGLNDENDDEEDEVA